MRAAILLLVACASNFLVWASPTAVMEPKAQERSQKHPWKESLLSLETAWAGDNHPPHGLSKRWTTLPDRRILVITIAQAVASSLQIATTYTIPFQYYYDSGINQVVYDYDHNAQFTMSWPAPLVVGQPPNGRDLAVPAIIVATASSVCSIVCTLIWGVKMRSDWNLVIGMGLFELGLITQAGHTVRIDPFMYSWRFDAVPPA